MAEGSKYPVQQKCNNLLDWWLADAYIQKNLLLKHLDDTQKSF
jgi:hypothetical protein